MPRKLKIDPLEVEKQKKDSSAELSQRRSIIMKNYWKYVKERKEPKKSFLSSSRADLSLENPYVKETKKGIEGMSQGSSHFHPFAQATKSSTQTSTRPISSDLHTQGTVLDDPYIRPHDLLLGRAPVKLSDLSPSRLKDQEDAVRFLFFGMYQCPPRKDWSKYILDAMNRLFIDPEEYPRIENLFERFVDPNNKEISKKRKEQIVRRLQQEQQEQIEEEKN